MLRKRYSLPLLVGLGVWLAIAAILLYTNLASAQQTSTVSTLSAPSLTAVAGEGAVELSWESVSGAARYELWTWTIAGGYQQLDDGSLTGTTYRHSDLIAGTIYHYWVRAVNASGEMSVWSERQAATIIAPSSNATPTHTATPTSTTSILLAPVLTAEAGAGKVELSWEAVTGAVRYELYTWTSADGWQRLDDGGLTGTSYSQTGVTVSTTYYYAIRAVNTEGETSEWSEYVSLTWATATPEDTPTSTPTSTPKSAPTESKSDRDALVALYNATDGPNWTSNSNWLSKRPLSEWYGVTTDDVSGRVTGLSLSSNLLRGSLPADLGQLTNLKNLNLSNNRLNGTIPSELGDLAHLEDLDLGINELSGSIPTSLGGLSKLETLQLSSNELTGPVPSQLSNLARLESLSLSHNELTGTIPSQLGNLSNLTGLFITHNQVSGTIPIQIGNLSKLEELYLSNNALTGTIPSQLGNLTALEYLTLSDNDLSGPIPTQLGSLVKLVHLYLQNNELTGMIPSVLGNLTALEFLYLAGNQFSGCIPEEIRFVGDNDFDSLGLPYCDTPTPTLTPTATLTATATPTATPTPGDTDPTPTPTAASTATPTATVTATATPTAPHRLPGKQTPVPQHTATATPTATPTAAPPTTSLSVPALSAQETDGGVKLSWTAVDGAERYELFVWEIAGDWRQIGGDYLTGTTYTHSEVKAGTTYYYQIRAVNAGGGTSAWSIRVSETITATVTATATPTAPHRLPGKQTPVPQHTATATPTATPTAAPPTTSLSVPALSAQATDGGVKLTWTAVTGAERYELFVWKSGVQNWLQIGGDYLTGTTFTHRNVDAGTTYYYVIRAVSIDGVPSSSSPLLSVTTTSGP